VAAHPVTGESTNLSQDITYVDGVILPSDIRHRPYGAVNGRVEPVIVLWCEAEDDERAADIPFGLILVCIAKKPCNSKFMALDPKSCCFVGRLDVSRACERRCGPAVRRGAHLAAHGFRRFWPPVSGAPRVVACSARSFGDRPIRRHGCASRSHLLCWRKSGACPA